MSELLREVQESAAQQDWMRVASGLQSLLVPSPMETLNANDHLALLQLALKVLESGDFQAQWEAAKVVPLFGSSAIAPLVGWLQDPEVASETRWFAARILGELGDPIAIQALAAALEEQDEEVSEMVTEALAHVGPSALGHLVALLEQAPFRLLAVKALAKIRHSHTITPLLEVTTDADPQVRAIAIEALSSFHDPRVPPVLLRALTDPASGVRRLAIAGLSVRQDLVPALNLVHHFTERLLDLNLDVCRQATIALGRIGTDEAAAALAWVLCAPATPLELRRQAAQCLGWIETATALDYLQQALTYLPIAESSPLHYDIITALGRWNASNLKPLVTDALIAILAPLGTQHETLKQALALALGQLGQPQALEPLIQLLADANPNVRLHAIAALKSLDSDQAYQRLVHLQSHPNLTADLKQGVVIALQEW